MQEVWRAIEKSFRVLSRTVFLNYVGNIMHLFGAKIWERILVDTPYSVIYWDEPRYALLDGKYFIVIDIYDKSKIRTKYQLYSQKWNVIRGNFQTHLRLNLTKTLVFNTNIILDSFLVYSYSKFILHPVQFFLRILPFLPVVTPDIH